MLNPPLVRYAIQMHYLMVIDKWLCLSPFGFGRLRPDIVTHIDNAPIGKGAGILHPARLDERARFMDGEQNGTQAQQVEQQESQTAQQQANQQETQGKRANETGTDAGAGGSVDAKAYEAQLTERDSRIAELERQITEAAKNAETADSLRAENPRVLFARPHKEKSPPLLA